jgi:hypothetical protein
MNASLTSEFTADVWPWFSTLLQGVGILALAAALVDFLRWHWHHSGEKPHLFNKFPRPAR